jgi:hypothetical protein
MTVYPNSSLLPHPVDTEVAWQGERISVRSSDRFAPSSSTRGHAGGRDSKRAICGRKERADRHEVGLGLYFLDGFIPVIVLL